MEIQHIIQNFAAIDEICWYSIDEGFVDLTSSLGYFYPDPQLTQAQKLDLLSRDIQQAIYKQTGIYATIGMSIGNPLLAKLALDNAAKHSKNMRAMWCYETIPTTVWKIPSLTDFWGINKRTEKRLNKLGIQSVFDLAHTHPASLKKEFGILGIQLFCHANGIDESNVFNRYTPNHRTISNSQTLPRDYIIKKEIEIVISELVEQVATRLRREKKKTRRVTLYVGYGFSSPLPAIHAQLSIEATNSTATLISAILSIFRDKYKTGPVRRLGITFGSLCDDTFELISLFEDSDTNTKQDTVQKVIDTIRRQYGFLSVQRATVLTSGSRAIMRSKLVGGHSAGGLDGLT